MKAILLAVLAAGLFLTAPASAARLEFKGCIECAGGAGAYTVFDIQFRAGGSIRAQVACNLPQRMRQLRLQPCVRREFRSFIKHVSLTTVIEQPSYGQCYGRLGNRAGTFFCDGPGSSSAMSTYRFINKQRERSR